MFRIIQTCAFVIFRGLYIPGWWRVSRWICQQKCVEIWSEPWLLAGNGAYECVQIWTRYDFASIRCGLKQLQMFTTEVNEHLFRVCHHFFELCIHTRALVILLNFTNVYVHCRDSWLKWWYFQIIYFKYPSNAKTRFLNVFFIPVMLLRVLLISMVAPVVLSIYYPCLPLTVLCEL